MSRLAKAAAVFTIVLLAPAAAHAQASINGTVSDTAGLELSGVRIEVSSPALSGKLRTITTDAKGQYQVGDLPPGTYTIVFARDGFATLKREGVELSGTFAARVNAVLRALAGAANTDGVRIGRRDIDR